MLLIGTPQCLDQLYNRLDLIQDINIIYNLSSMAERYRHLPSLNTLLEPIQTIPINEMFEYNYFNYMMMNEIPFCQLMSIMVPLYEGKNVFILTYRSESFDIVTETLSKLIQSRYGYNSIYVNSVDDIEALPIDIMERGDFSVNGIQAFDKDRERYTEIVEFHKMDGLTSKEAVDKYIENLIRRLD